MNPITPISSLHHVAISVQDIAGSVAFYERLGFRVVATWADPGGSLMIKHLALGRFLLEVFAYREGTDDGLSSRSLADDLKIRGVRHIGVRVPDVHKAYQEIRSAGMTPLGPVQHGRTGIDYFFVRDPDGVFVEFVQDDRDVA